MGQLIAGYVRNDIWKDFFSEGLVTGEPTCLYSDSFPRTCDTCFVFQVVKEVNLYPASTQVEDDRFIHESPT